LSFVKEQQAGSRRVVANVPMQVVIVTRDHLVVLLKTVCSNELDSSTTQVLRGSHDSRIEAKSYKRRRRTTIQI
jgi:hypothetical protein